MRRLGQLWKEAVKGKERTEQCYKGTPNYTLPTFSELKSLLLSSLCRADKGFPMPPGYRVRRVLFSSIPTRMSCILIAMFSCSQRSAGAKHSIQVEADLESSTLQGAGRVWGLMLGAHLSRAMAVME